VVELQAMASRRAVRHIDSVCTKLGGQACTGRRLHAMVQAPIQLAAAAAVLVGSDSSLQQPAAFNADGLLRPRPGRTEHIFSVTHNPCTALKL